MHLFQHLLCDRPMLGIWTNHLQPPHSCNMGLPFPPSSLQRRKMRLIEVNHLPQFTLHEAAELELDLGCLTSSFNASNRASSLSWKERA
jgi:hypothetical protein